MLLSLDGTLVVQLVNFIVFLLILNAIFLRPVGAAIAERRAFIDAIAHDIEQFRAQLNEFDATAAERLASARRAGEAHVSDVRAAAQNEAAAIVADHQAQAAAVAQQAQEAVALEARAARANEADVVNELARTMLERAVGPGLAV
jgi:F-type H+-transporting ATPase subunit b